MSCAEARGKPPRCADNQRNSVENVWTLKKLRMNSRRLLRDGLEGRRNAFTAGNGHHPGGLPRGAGKAGKPVFAAGAWHRRAARGAGVDGKPDGPGRRGGQTSRAGNGGAGELAGSARRDWKAAGQEW